MTGNITLHGEMLYNVECPSLKIMNKIQSHNHHCALLCWVAQSCPTLCDPMDCSPPSSSVHGDPPGRDTEWIAMLSSRGSSQPRDWAQVSHIAGGFFTIWVTSEAQYWSGQPIPSLGDLSDPGIQLGSPALQVDSLPAELTGKHTVTTVGHQSPGSLSQSTKDA